MTCFQILSPLQSYSVFISSCLGGSGEQASLHTQCSQGWHNNPSDSITISSLLFRMHGWFNNALSCTPSQRSHLLDLPQGTQCKFPLSHSKLHAAVYCFGFFFFSCSIQQARIRTQNCTWNTLHILLQPQAIAERGSELPFVTALSSVWQLNY